MTYFKYALLILATAFVFGCAAPGPKYINLAYTGTPEADTPSTLGISRFEDKRDGHSKGGIGHRTLNDKTKEVFLVPGLDLAGTLTDLTQTFIEKKGLTVKPVHHWTPTIEGLAAAQADTDYLLTARINAFHCTAQKKGALTEMTLEIDLTFFQGKPASKSLTSIPVNLTLTRTDVNFTREKVETFFNDTLAEVLEKGLTF